MLEEIAEELNEVESLPELKALWCFGEKENNVYALPECVPLFKAALTRLKVVVPEEVPAEQEKVEDGEVNNAELIAKLAELQAEIERLTAAQVKPPVTVRSSKKYRLLKFDVSWTTKRQVHAIAAILEAHAKVGDVLDEVDIINMMEANVAVLETRQGGRKVWNYYKGNSDDGLMAHGNIEVA